MNDMIIIKPEGVQGLINKFCYVIGNIPTSYKLGVTIEEQILAIGQYLEEKVYPALNNNAEALAELQSLFVQLKDYVQNYFGDLDVQEEINNKLDEMVDSGQLTEIIAQYLQLAGVLAYNDINDLKNATNVVVGTICKTLGKNSYNDGLGNYYKVREIVNTDIIDDYNIIALSDLNLVAERIENWKKVQYFKINNFMSEEEIKKIIEINDFAKIIEFENGVYNFHSPLHLKSNTKFILNNSTLNFDFSNNSNVKILGYEPDSEYTAYNGKSNIEFINGSIKTGIALMHNTNIKFINITFDKSTGHAIQMGGCKNIEINGCIFNPSTERESIENNEIIQLETCTRLGQPWLDDENSPSYDNTPNENIKILNCEFLTGDNETTFSYSFIGNHSQDTQHNYFNKNIVIENNIFNSSVYGKISGYGFDGLKILNNRFNSIESPTTHANIKLRGYNKNIEIKNNTIINGIIGFINVNVQTMENVIIENNIIELSEDNSIAIEIQGVKNCVITKNLLKSKSWSVYISAPTGTEATNVLVDSNSIDRTIATDHAVKLYHGTNLKFSNNKVIQNNNTYYFIHSNDSSIDYSVIDNVFDVNDNSLPKLVTGNVNYNKLYQGQYDCYSGAGTYSTLTNVTPAIALTNFNKLLLLLHKPSGPTVMKYEELRPFSIGLKISERKYPLIFVDDNGTPHYGLFQINSDDTFNFSSDGSFVLRHIYATNEIANR